MLSTFPCLSAELPDNTLSVVVTGTRIAERQDEIPQAISVISGQEISFIGGVNPGAFLSKVPGVSFVPLTPTTNLDLSLRRPRGFGPYYLYLQDSLPIQDPILFDNSGLSRAGYLLFPSRIEVARGPAPLYGSNAVAGVVNVLPPDLGRSEGTAELEGAEYGLGVVRAKQSLGSANLRGLGAFALSTENGFRHSSSFSRVDALFRGGVVRCISRAVAICKQYAGRNRSNASGDALRARSTLEWSLLR
jgi:outer membrane receptor protein involved in Fe transport